MAPSLREYWNTGDNGQYDFYGVYWRAQTFTTGAAAHTITSVKLLLFRSGSPGTVAVSIRAVDGSGHPTGSDLTSGTTDGNTLPTASPYELREITLTEYQPATSTKYAIVVRVPSGNASNKLRWRTDGNNEYSGGGFEQSSDSGSSWAAVQSIDGLFEVWGNDVVTYVNVSDSGAGSESATMTATLSAADSGLGTESDVAIGPVAADGGVGVDTILATSVEMTVTDAGAGAESPTVNASLSSSDSGVGAETPSIQNQLTETDEGLGTESIVTSASLTVSESGAGVDTRGVQASIPISDSAVGSDLVSPPSAAMTVADSGLGLENVTTPGTLTVNDEGKGAEFAWRTKPSSPMIDALALPHVLSIRIFDPATMSDKKVQGGSLPRRTMVGKPGRVVEVDGWSDSQTEIDALDALRDGERHTFYHPSGDSFGVLVTGFEPSATVDEYDRRTYRLSLAEAN
jgi:hypothetical protein